MYIFIYLLLAILLHFDNKIYLQKKNEVDCSFFNYMVRKKGLKKCMVRFKNS